MWGDCRNITAKWTGAGAAGPAGQTIAAMRYPVFRCRQLALALAFGAGGPLWLGAQAELTGQSANTASLQRMMTQRLDVEREIPVYDQHIQRAYSLLAEGNFGEGYRFLNYAIKEDPNRADAYVGFAIAARARQQYPAAERALRKAIEVEPDNPRVHHEMARLLLVKRVPAEALAEIEQAIALDGGEDWKTHEVRGEALIMLDRLEEAADAYGRALQLAERKLGMVKRAIAAEGTKEEIVSMGTEIELVNEFGGGLREIEVLRFDTTPKEVPSQWFQVRDRLEQSVAKAEARLVEIRAALAGH